MKAPRAIFDTTTTVRSSHVGQPGYDGNDDWQHFFEKYRSRCLRFAQSRFPWRPDIAEDAFANVVEKILVNPNVLQRKPGKHFAPVIATLTRNAAIDILRKEKQEVRDRYARLTEPLREDSYSIERERGRLRLFAVDLICRDLLREDYENGRFCREIDALDLEIWRLRQAEHATDSGVARELGFSSGTKVRTAVARVDERIRADAERLLVSLGLM